ncbi:unnamed protein product [Closterium sp. Yama58-4]|nr:unnamed protein product [Closterium sp. Yama58-4]
MATSNGTAMTEKEEATADDGGLLDLEEGTVEIDADAEPGDVECDAIEGLLEVGGGDACDEDLGDGDDGLGDACDENLGDGDDGLGEGCDVDIGDGNDGLGDACDVDLAAGDDVGDAGDDEGEAEVHKAKKARPDPSILADAPQPANGCDASAKKEAAMPDDPTAVALNPADCSIDFAISDRGLLGAGLSHGGFAYMWSGARANYGIALRSPPSATPASASGAADADAAARAAQAGETAQVEGGEAAEGRGPAEAGAASAHDGGGGGGGGGRYCFACVVEEEQALDARVLRGGAAGAAAPGGAAAAADKAQGGTGGEAVVGIPEEERYMCRVGVSTLDTDVESLGETRGSFAYCSSGKKVAGGVVSPYARPWARGDVVLCAVDLPARALAFALNGAWLGEAFRLPPLRSAAELAEGGGGGEGDEGAGGGGVGEMGSAEAREGGEGVGAVVGKGEGVVDVEEKRKAEEGKAGGDGVAVEVKRAEGDGEVAAGGGGGKGEEVGGGETSEGEGKKETDRTVEKREEGGEEGKEGDEEAKEGKKEGKEGKEEGKEVGKEGVEKDGEGRKEEEGEEAKEGGEESKEGTREGGGVGEGEKGKSTVMEVDGGEQGRGVGGTGGAGDATGEDSVSGGGVEGGHAWVGAALFPHVLVKNVKVRLQFSLADGLSPPPGYLPWSDAPLLSPPCAAPPEASAALATTAPTSMPAAAAAQSSGETAAKPEAGHGESGDRSEAAEGSQRAGAEGEVGAGAGAEAEGEGGGASGASEAGGEAVVVRVAGPALGKREECEVVMMVGLPGSGKSTWAAERARAHPEKRYVVLGTDRVLSLMQGPGGPGKQGERSEEGYGQRWAALMPMASQVFGELVERAAALPRNYILDQTNVYAHARRRKLRPFHLFKKVAVVVVLTYTEWRRRSDRRTKETGKEVPLLAVQEMKANFVLPLTAAESRGRDVFDEVLYPALPRPQAHRIVDRDRFEAQRLLQATAITANRPFTSAPLLPHHQHQRQQQQQFHRPFPQGPPMRPMPPIGMGRGMGMGMGPAALGPPFPRAPHRALLSSPPSRAGPPPHRMLHHPSPPLVHPRPGPPSPFTPQMRPSVLFSPPLRASPPIGPSPRLGPPPGRFNTSPIQHSMPARPSHLLRSAPPPSTFPQFSQQRLPARGPPDVRAPSPHTPAHQRAGQHVGAPVQPLSSSSSSSSSAVAHTAPPRIWPWLVLLDFCCCAAQWGGWRRGGLGGRSRHCRGMAGQRLGPQGVRPVLGPPGGAAGHRGGPLGGHAHTAGPLYPRGPRFPFPRG